MFRKIVGVEKNNSNLFERLFLVRQGSISCICVWRSVINNCSSMRWAAQIMYCRVLLHCVNFPETLKILNLMSLLLVKLILALFDFCNGPFVNVLKNLYYKLSYELLSELCICNCIILHVLIFSHLFCIALSFSWRIYIYIYIYIYID